MGGMGSSAEAEAAFAVALRRRGGLADGADGADGCLRLIHGAADGFPGVTVDRYGPAWLVERHRADADVAAVVALLVARFGAGAPIVVKRRDSRAAADLDGAQVAGAPLDPAGLVVSEGGLRFAVWPTRGEHVGLFLDGRLARGVVRRVAAGRRVLNLFAYTCAFGVAAAAGGARSTTNVDAKRSALAAGRSNYERNGLPVDTRTFVEADAIEHLRRGARGRGRYDLVVVDPPGRFRRRGGRGFEAAEGYGRLVARCLRLLEPGGLLLAGHNTLQADDADLAAYVAAGAAAAPARLRLVEAIGPGPGFPSPSDRPVSRFRLYEREA
jgi:23S rRNA (cytosine1962-C5)-methyltransferase